MSYTVYKITNQINKKVYIGLTTVSIKERWKKHIYDTNNKKTRMSIHRAMRKYGIENFKIEKVTECNNLRELNKAEIRTIKLFNSTKPQNGYNQTKGGKGFAGYKQDKKTIEKRANQLRGRHRSEETKKKISEAMKGKLHSKAHNQKVSKAHKGKQLSEETKKKMSDYWRNRPRPYLRKKVDQYNSNNKLIKTYKSISKASAETGILITAISNALNNRAKTAGGYIWHYH